MTPTGLRCWELGRLERAHLDAAFSRDASLRIDTALIRFEAAEQAVVHRDVDRLLAEVEAMVA